MVRVSLNSLFITEKPSVKFGEALRDQVEERLKFFETGEPPSRNAEAIRKVLEAIALEDEGEGSDDEEEEGDEDRMKVDDSPRKDAAGFSILPLIENSPLPESPKKSKKRKGHDDQEEEKEGVPKKKIKLSSEEEEAPRKKVKPSKEEKKALRKELRRKRKEEEKATGVRPFSDPLTNPRSFRGSLKKEKEKKEKKEKKGKAEKVVDGTTTEKPERKEKKEKKKKNKESSS